jgi:acetyl-CoA carboxylase biotin carboxyl carrier protein
MPTVTIASEVAGNVWKLLVQAGEAVAADQDLLIIESMKMEIPVSAPSAGTVQDVLVAEGEAVGEEQVLLRLQTP